MEGLDFSKRTVFPVKMPDGKSYSVTAPSVKDMEEHQARVSSLSKEEMEGPEMIDVALQLLERLGLPKSSAKDLEMGQMSQLISEITSSKKK